MGSKKAGLLGPAFLLVVLCSSWALVADDGEAPLAGAVGEADGVVAGCQCGEVELALACGLGAPVGGLEGAALEVQDGDSEVEDVGAEVEVERQGAGRGVRVGVDAVRPAIWPTLDGLVTVTVSGTRSEAAAHSVHADLPIVEEVVVVLALPPLTLVPVMAPKSPRAYG